ncbi:2-oxoglutarate dehydrogenase, E2 component, dihydrolipoamide succinyltransferase [Actinomadura syzygii]|uniref:Dihydrolipoamide acetyltransferase component of pyruvate dehydrogenase complex n=1 Tax=Actinomadura syzygii TaxID=1427538 RepID=A0A5D0UCZ0_9ACTN|nr:2-oxoglutarate dehydrogenase, E2 component, dihydrolipoamide succinyltransferase [Actinomadura syzygii]TYC15443.1 2-oxoglutarate dehydrogenase, E2 component, dihydrolipoamide succinyltransferase [Actinomadura syzygii]
MDVPVTMPQLGESVTEGTVTRWLKGVGESVEADEPLLEVSTDKVDTEIPSPASGILQSILVQEDETVDTGTQLATITESAPAAAPPAAPPPLAPVAQPIAATPQPVASVPHPVAPARTHAGVAHRGRTGSGGYVTPFVRTLAREHGVDLASLRPSRTGDRIRRNDVLAAARPAPQAPLAPVPQTAATPPVPQTAVGSPVPQVAVAPPIPQVAVTQPVSQGARAGAVAEMGAARRAFAAGALESLRTSAHLTTVVEVDVTETVRACEAAAASFRAREGVELTLRPFLALAALSALKAHPLLGARVDLDRKVIVHPDGTHLAVTVDMPGGPVAPVVRDAGHLNLAGLARALDDLGERARTGRLVPDDLGGATFTLDDRSAEGALFGTAVIAQPQVAVLGAGAVTRRPVAVAHPELGEVVAVRSMLYLALTYDHRLIDGADAARFLTAVAERLADGGPTTGPGI